MDNTKQINQFSLNDVDLEKLLKVQTHSFASDDALVILNGDIQRSPLFQQHEVYQIAEPRIVLVVEGHGSVCINLKDYHLKKGSVILVGGDTILEVNEISPDTRLTAIVLRDSIDIPEEVVFQASPVEFDRLLRMFYLIWDVIQLSPYRKRTVQNLFKAIIANIQEIKKEEEDSVNIEGSMRTQNVFLQFKRLVHQHCLQERSIPFYANLLHLTPHHLSAVIKKASGQSVMFWINRATIQAAKLLLKNNDMMAYEIADRMNFPSASAFSKFFKRETGITPRAYQESTRK